MYTENNGVKIWYEVHGEGKRTLVIVHGFQIAYSEFFKRAYVPFLSRHMRVVTLDLRGNGRSGRPEGGYDLETYVEDVHAVVEAVRLQRFAMAGHSLGVGIITKYHATHPGKANQLILLNGAARVVRSEDYPQGEPKEDLEAALQNWREQPETMLKGFIKLVCSEKHSLRSKELIWEWAHETSPKILAMGWEGVISSDVDEYLKDIDIPALIINGQKDELISPGASEYLHKQIPGSKLIRIPDAGHGFTRTWPQVSRHILGFLKPETSQHPRLRKQEENPRILWISSPIGLGHVKRDVAIAEEIRKKIPKLTIHWLAVDPVRSFLEAIGEEIHPLSDALVNESSHFESRAAAYSLDAMEALWEMDKLLNNNFMVFTDAVRKDGYDLVVGDESWE
ncbi:hypothetical protein LCGC14_2697070, partial [marine sediment metagenome]